jgi:FkbM family methyltransferase
VTSFATLRTKALLHARDNLLRLGLPYQLRHFHRLGKHEFRVRVKGVGDLTMRPKSGDAAVVSQVFSLLQYDTSQFPQHARVVKAYNDILARNHRPLILDLGANNGASARWFAREYPEASIVSVEPDADNARLCRFNTEGYPIEVVTAAIGGSPGRVLLDTVNMGSVSYTTTRSSDGGVPVVTVGQILADRPDHELFIVKIDSEGFEDDLFATGTEWVDKAHVIMIEPHDFKFPNRDTSRHFQETMGRLPFQVLVSWENLVYVRHA